VTTPPDGSSANWSYELAHGQEEGALPPHAVPYPQGGPQVSRAPQDVRGRLSSLRRGVQRGHSEGSISKGRADMDTHSGPTGPDSTYNQER